MHDVSYDMRIKQVYSIEKMIIEYKNRKSL